MIVIYIIFHIHLQKHTQKLLLARFLTYLFQIPVILPHSFLHQTYFDSGKLTNISIVYGKYSVTVKKKTAIHWPRNQLYVTINIQAVRIFNTSNLASFSGASKLGCGQQERSQTTGDERRARGIMGRVKFPPPLRPKNLVKRRKTSFCRVETSNVSAVNVAQAYFAFPTQN